ncbi:MAG: CRISPR-associated endonuclease Cas1 [Synergistetes bacterium]|nr:CRISPR-associated endonuclease Cas1 [Synergistota bacterium]
MRSYPDGGVEKIILFGNIRLSPQLITYSLKKGIEVVFLSAKGNYKGRLQGNLSKNVFLRLLQYDKHKDTNFRLSLAKEFVRGKVRNSISILQKYNWDIKSKEISETCSFLRSVLMKIEICGSLESLMGMEGAAAEAYFRALNLCVKNEIFNFSSRTRRPPEDPANAVLSFLYTLLFLIVESSIYTEGLDPYVGFYHSVDYGRPSLALDLMEEFRPFMDRIFLRLSNKKMLMLGDFRFCQEEDEESAGVYLTHEGIKKVIAEFQEQVKSRSLDRIINSQVNLLSKAIKGESVYRSYMIKL